MVEFTLSSAWAFCFRTLFFQAEQLERRRRQEHEGGSRGPAVKGRGRGEGGARVEIWIRPSGQAATPSSQRGGSESSRDSEQDGELGSLSASDVSSFAHSVSLIHTQGHLPFHVCTKRHWYMFASSIFDIFPANRCLPHSVIEFSFPLSSL